MMQMCVQGMILFLVESIFLGERHIAENDEGNNVME